MAKAELRRQAIKLRKQGQSYSQIKNTLHVSKSTLSIWLKEFPLTEEQLKILRDFSEVRIEKYRNTMRIKRSRRLESYLTEEKEKWLPLSDRELFFAGLFLYWGEGNKVSRGSLSISNNDPNLLRFALLWMTKSLKLPREQIRVALHLYSDMDIATEINYWSEQLNIPQSQFEKPYIKSSTRASIDQKGFGHGTCGLRIHRTVIKERVMAALQAISLHYSTLIAVNEGVN